LLFELLHIVSQRISGEPFRDPKGTRKNSPAERQLKAFRRGMHVRSPAGLLSSWIWNHGQAEPKISRDNSQQLLLGGSLFASHTGADGV